MSLQNDTASGTALFFFFHSKTFYYFQKFLERSDQNKSGDISIAEFIHYVKEHEKNLRLQFSDLDKNKDGEFNKYCRSNYWGGLMKGVFHVTSPLYTPM